MFFANRVLFLLLLCLIMFIVDSCWIFAYYYKPTQRLPFVASQQEIRAVHKDSFLITDVKKLNKNGSFASAMTTNTLLDKLFQTTATINFFDDPSSSDLEMSIIDNSQFDNFGDELTFKNISPVSLMTELPPLSSSFKAKSKIVSSEHAYSMHLLWKEEYGYRETCKFNKIDIDFAKEQADFWWKEFVKK